jgi:hypothetical protein
VPNWSACVVRRRAAGAEARSSVNVRPKSRGGSPEGRAGPYRTRAAGSRRPCAPRGEEASERRGRKSLTVSSGRSSRDRRCHERARKAEEEAAAERQRIADERRRLRLRRSASRMSRPSAKPTSAPLGNPWLDQLAIMACGVDEPKAKEITLALAAGNVPHIVVKF